MKYLVLVYHENEFTVFRFDTVGAAESKMEELRNYKGIESAELLEYITVDEF